MFFEWGAARRKNADTALIKHLILLCSSALITAFLGFGAAFGDPHVIGTRYYMSIGVVKEKVDLENDPELALNYVLLVLVSSVTAVISVSSQNERQSLVAQIAFGVWIQILVTPLLTAWTFGGGFLSKLYMDDEAGCLCLHLVCGLSAFAGCLFVAPRLGKFDPLQLNQGFENTDSDSEEEKLIPSAHALQKKKSQNKIDKVARRFDLQTSGTPKNLFVQLEKVRRIVRISDNDSFFARNSHLAMFVGTVLMWISLGYVSASITLNFTLDNKDCNQVLINFMLAGCGGAIGSHLFSKNLKFFKYQKEKRIFQNYLSIGADFENQREQTNLRKVTYYINLDADIELFILLRGIMAGCVSISMMPSEYVAWTAFINGVIAGMIFIFSCRLMHIFEFDDPNMISQIHGACALYSCFSVCMFHKTEGFFFKNIYPTIVTVDPVTNATITKEAPVTIEQLQLARKEIMKVLGSNFLGNLGCWVLVIVMTGLPLYVASWFKLLRVRQANELLGQDLCNQVELWEGIKNHVNEVINEYYPENIQDYLLSKYKLLEAVKANSSTATRRLEQDDAKRLLAYVEKEIAIQEKREAYVKQVTGRSKERELLRDTDEGDEKQKL